MKNCFKTAAIAACSLCLGATFSMSEERVGEKEFMKSCAVCHGSDGKGNGPILDYLKSAPADLTTISSRNGGVFPFQAAYDTVTNVETNRAHGTSEMPVWGDRFNMQIITEEGEIGTGASRIPSAHTRILELVFFLGTIQE